MEWEAYRWLLAINEAYERGQDDTRPDLAPVLALLRDTQVPLPQEAREMLAEFLTPAKGEAAWEKRFRLVGTSPDGWEAAHELYISRSEAIARKFQVQHKMMRDELDSLPTGAKRTRLKESIAALADDEKAERTKLRAEIGREFGILPHERGDEIGDADWRDEHDERSIKGRIEKSGGNPGKRLRLLRRLIDEAGGD